MRKEMADMTPSLVVREAIVTMVLSRRKGVLSWRERVMSRCRASTSRRRLIQGLCDKVGVAA